MRNDGSNGIRYGSDGEDGQNGEPGECLRPVNVRLWFDPKKMVANISYGENFLKLIEANVLYQSTFSIKAIGGNGGDGGNGNWEFRSARNTTPMKAQKGFPGEAMNLTLNLKLIADYGLIGLPNSGKSSLLNELTNSNAKIGNYAFTTLSPNLGAVNGKVVADIPGLIEGASLS